MPFNMIEFYRKHAEVGGVVRADLAMKDVEALQARVAELEAALSLTAEPHDEPKQPVTRTEVEAMIERGAREVVAQAMDSLHDGNVRGVAMSANLKFTAQAVRGQAGEVSTGGG